MKAFLAAATATLLAAASLAQRGPTADVDPIYPELEKLYMDLHEHPELSFQEIHTSAKIAARLRQLGYEVTEKVGRTGVVAVLRNGPGPTVAIREDMDALPVEEKTGLSYASHVTATDSSGATVPVMHACGHDIHMTSLVGAATLLAQSKGRWRGTLVLVFQPAEETGSGAATMIRDGLFTRFPRPQFVIGFHDSSNLPAGKLVWVAGYARANVDSVDVTIFGRGGHGASPESTVDPIVIAARTVVSLQTLVSRENNPLDPAVVTVGSFHAGTKHNIIPDEAKLQLTVRSYRDDVRKKLLAGIERIAKSEAAAARAPKEPRVEITEGTPSLYNDPELTHRIAGAFERDFGKENVAEGHPLMVGEDIAEFARAGIPTLQYEVGGVEPQKWQAAQKSGASLPSLHSSQWAPNRPITIRAGVASLAGAAMELLGKPSP